MCSSNGKPGTIILVNAKQANSDIFQMAEQRTFSKILAKSPL